MAKDNVAVVARLFEGFARRDDREAFEVYDDEIVWDARAMQGPGTNHDVFHGHDGVRNHWRQWLEAWDEIEVVDGPHHQSSGNQVISNWRQRNRGKRSGLEVELEVGIVWTFEGDRIVRVALFPSRADALAAAGLRE